MGELTATKRAFNPTKDISEADVEFVPSFWSATSMIINEGPSKADQTGRKRRQNPRIIPVNGGTACPTTLVRRTLIERYQLTRELHPVPPFDKLAPLFQNQSGGQLTQRQVQSFLKGTLRRAGLPADDYGTHSFRIGGFNRLFLMEAHIEQIKRIGGWSSDAWKEYVRIQQSDCLSLTRRMLSDEV